MWKNGFWLNINSSHFNRFFGWWINNNRERERDQLFITKKKKNFQFESSFIYVKPYKCPNLVLLLLYPYLIIFLEKMKETAVIFMWRLDRSPWIIINVRHGDEEGLISCVCMCVCFCWQIWAKCWFETSHTYGREIRNLLWGERDGAGKMERER